MKNRKRNRLIGFDYSTHAIYFITICCDKRIHYFGDIQNNEMILNEFGIIAENQIYWLQQQYSYFNIHNYVVMPNHVHILFAINRTTVGTGRDLSMHNETQSEMTGRDLSLRKIKSVSELIGAYKTTSSKMIHNAGNISFKWQRSFFDNIVRDYESYNNIYNYIDRNPILWNEDSLKNPIM